MWLYGAHGSLYGCQEIVSKEQGPAALTIEGHETWQKVGTSRIEVNKQLCNLFSY